MTQAERRQFLLDFLLSKYTPEKRNKITIPKNTGQQRLLLRTLISNLPTTITNPEVLDVQDEYLQELLQDRGIATVDFDKQIFRDVYLHKGDLTNLLCDAIVCPANSKLQGLPYPSSKSVENAIHLYAGFQLRIECERIIAEQGHDEPVGQAKLTSAYNLPCQYILHTVPPTMKHGFNAEIKAQVSACIESCLRLADKRHLKHVAFPTVYKSVVRTAYLEAIKTTVSTVLNYKQKTGSHLKIVLCMDNENERDFYQQLLDSKKPSSPPPTITDLGSHEHPAHTKQTAKI